MPWVEHQLKADSWELVTCGACHDAGKVQMLDVAVTDENTMVVLCRSHQAVVCEFGVVDKKITITGVGPNVPVSG